MLEVVIGLFSKIFPPFRPPGCLLRDWQDIDLFLSSFSFFVFPFAFNPVFVNEPFFFPYLSCGAPPFSGGDLAQKKSSLYP